MTFEQLSEIADEAEKVIISLIEGHLEEINFGPLSEALEAAGYLKNYREGG